MAVCQGAHTGPRFARGSQNSVRIRFYQFHAKKNSRGKTYCCKQPTGTLCFLLLRASSLTFSELYTNVQYCYFSELDPSISVLKQGHYVSGADSAVIFR
jgi:hypothetical protein